MSGFGTVDEGMVVSSMGVWSIEPDPGRVTGCIEVQLDAAAFGYAFRNVQVCTAPDMASGDTLILLLSSVLLFTCCFAAAQAWHP